jgi:hypothetical protein
MPNQRRFKRQMSRVNTDECHLWELAIGRLVSGGWSAMFWPLSLLRERFLAKVFARRSGKNIS